MFSVFNWSASRKGCFPPLKNMLKCYAMTEERLKQAKSDLLVLHPRPMNRTIEIPTAVADSAQCTVEEQVTNGVACRMALLYLMSGGGQMNKILLKGGRVIDPFSGL